MRYPRTSCIIVMRRLKRWKSWPGHCGVPAYYIEDCLQKISYTAKPCPRFLKENTKPILSSIPTRQTRIVTSKEDLHAGHRPLCPVDEGARRQDGRAREYTLPERQRTSGIYLYGLMALEHLSQQHNPVRCTAHPVRYDGFRWSYHAYRISDTQYPIRALAVSRPTREAEGHINTYRIISADLHTVK